MSGQAAGTKNAVCNRYRLGDPARRTRKNFTFAIGDVCRSLIGPRCCASDPALGYTPYARVNDGFPPRLESAIRTLSTAAMMAMAQFCHFQSMLSALSPLKSRKSRLTEAIALKAHIGDALGKLGSPARKLPEKLVTPTGIEPVFQP